MTNNKKPLPITREMVSELESLTVEARTHWKVSEVVSEPRELRIRELRGKVWRTEPLLALLDRIDELEKEIEHLKEDRQKWVEAADELSDRIVKMETYSAEDEIEQKAWELWAAEYKTAPIEPKCDEAFYAAEHFINYRNRRRQEKKG